MVEGVDFAGAFVGAAFGADELHVDAEFVEQVFVVHHFGAHAAEVDHAGGMEAETVGQRGDVVAALGVAGGVGDDGLAAVAEGLQRVAQFGERAP